MVSLSDVLHAFAKHKFPQPLPKHLKVTAKTLAKLSQELESRNVKHYLDEGWPFHLLVPMKNRYISACCTGLRKYIDIQQLTVDGTADTRFSERSFSTTKGASNYIARKVKR
jgi:hypothetical protein